MISTIRSEWIKLRSVRSNLVMMGVALFVPMAIVLLTVSFMDVLSVSDVTIAELLAGSGTFSVMMLGVVGVLSVTQEYSQGTIRITLAATPRRVRVHLAKIAVVVAVSVVIMAIVILLGRLAGAAILDSRGFDGTLGYDGEGAVYGALLLISMVVGVLGCAAGTITRNPPGAISALLLWPLVVESIVGGVLGVLVDGWKQDWMPFQTGLNGVLVSTHDLEFGRWGSIGYFSLWVAALSLVAVRLLRRRDA
jgi:ABC-2 type transport system permease protein